MKIIKAKEEIMKKKKKRFNDYISSISSSISSISPNRIYCEMNSDILGVNSRISDLDKISDNIIKERKRHGDFKSFEDFCQRVSPRQCNKRVKENLIGAGAFDNIPIVHEETEYQARFI